MGSSDRDRDRVTPRRPAGHTIRGERGREARLSAVDAAALAAELRTVVRGEVRFDAGGRALYSMDASNYRQLPIGVVLPRDAEDIIQTLAVCRRYGAPVLPRGGGTSLAGQTCNVAVILDTSKYLHHVLEIDPYRRRARVQPGTILDDLREQAERHHLTFGPDPSTHSRCTLGGMIGNNSCGVHSAMAGKTADNVEELEILTYDGLRLRVGPTSEEELETIIRAGGRRGQIYSRLRALRDRYAPLVRERFAHIPRRVSGYNLDALLPENGFHVARALVGTEGTCVTILEAVLRLVSSPPARVLVVLAYPDVYRAADQVTAILDHQPIGLEGFDERLVTDMRKKGLHPEGRALLPEGGGWLLVELGAERHDEAVDRARTLMAALTRQGDPPRMALLDDARRQHLVWEVRESGLGGTARTPGGPATWPGWEDSAVPPARFGSYLRDLRGLLDRYSYGGAFYGHFGQGCLHTRIDFDLNSASGIATFRSFMRDAADLVVEYGGSLSGEHGDGQARAELLPKQFGAELVEAFREFKAIWDPAWKMNPGKVVDAYRLDENLRLGASYAPAQPTTHFKFPDDHGSLADATLRCVGVGKCRRTSGGTMCPSYVATREEAHSTRGRAHLLFEMLQGDGATGGWRDEHIKDALDLCLACKGCKGECPVNVDVATYKAEFLSHYYAGRLRPLSAYSIGLIYWSARLAARMPGVANFLLHAPVLGGLAKWLGGIAPERTLPTVAPQTFKTWFHLRPPRNVAAPPVMLWADTVNNHFYPETAMAAVEVLEAAGYHVIVPPADRPRQALCCGRPLYDFGMLDMAETLLRRILETLRPQIRAGIPLVGLEPSCVSVFRDELLNLFPNDEDAHRLAGQTYLLSEFLARQTPDYQPPSLRRKVVVHGHCHHKAVLGMRDEERILSRLGLDYDVLDSGCCGMAGAFGFERAHYDVSMRIGERVLLPAVRAAASDTLVIADGFSCREQIAQATDRRALHLAEVLQLALREREGEAGPADRSLVASSASAKNELALRPVPTALLVAAGLAGIALAGGALMRRLRSRRSRTLR
jgi:FAD/FMN-containing dehydrogenase/Fe-S oxidoreductase